MTAEYKRALCKGLSGVPKAAKDIEALVHELAPDKPIKSIAFAGNSAAAVTGYNVFVAGPTAAADALPPTIGHCPTSSANEIYAYFLSRKSTFLISEADKMIAQMLTDNAKDLQPLIVASSMKDAATARKNSLMKRAFVHESKKAFIDKLKSEGGVELCACMCPVAPCRDFLTLHHVAASALMCLRSLLAGSGVINGDISASQFGEFCGIVFELFYRTNLDMFG